MNKHRNLGNFFHSVQGTKETIGTFNKFVFMADGNRVEIVNEESGVWLDNTWYSNVYSFEEGYRKKAKVQRKTFRG
ncbi:MAG: hypothetical protein GWN56_14320 [Nitrosopumilaceae archaeon]|nr:hypothetical protein [Nitrosopumilaceae archaeon]